MAINPFSVVAGFKFEIGGAMLGLNQLQAGLGKVDSATERLQASFASLGMSLAGSLGMGSAGLLGLARQSVAASERFQKAQQDFSAMMAANKHVLTGDVGTHALRTATATSIIKDIVGDSRQFGLDEMAHLEMTKAVSAMTMQKGLSGTNMEESRLMSRDLLKSAPILGINPMDSIGQLLRSIEGGASMGDTLFRRLTGETEAMREFSGKGGSKKFNALKTEERWAKLREAMAAFTDPETMAARLNTLNAQMNIFHSITGGLNSIFRKLGDTIKKPIIMAMREVNLILIQQGQNIVDNFDQILHRISQNPMMRMVDLMQLKSLKSDVNKAKNLVITMGFVESILWVVGKAFSNLKGILTKLHTPIAAAIFAVGIFADIVGRVPNPLFKIAAIMSQIVAIGGAIVIVLAVFGKLGVVLAGIGTVFMAVFPPVIAALGIMQLISRAVAIAKVSDAKAIPALLARASDIMRQLAEGFMILMSPFYEVFNTLAQWISPLFKLEKSGGIVLTVFQWLADVMMDLGIFVARAAAAVAGLGAAFGTFVTHITEDWAQIAAGNLNLGDKTQLAYLDGFNDFLSKALTKKETDGEGIVKNNIQVDKINIVNEFKEKQEPDRIAFTIKDQIMKAAINPLQASGNSFSTAGRALQGI